MKMELDLRNAIQWSKRETKEYLKSYGYMLDEIVEIAKNKYYLTENESDQLKRSLVKWNEKNNNRYFK